MTHDSQTISFDPAWPWPARACGREVAEGTAGLVRPSKGVPAARCRAAACPLPALLAPARAALAGSAAGGSRAWRPRSPWPRHSGRAPEAEPLGQCQRRPDGTRPALCRRRLAARVKAGAAAWAAARCGRFSSTRRGPGGCMPQARAARRRIDGLPAARAREAFWDRSRARPSSPQAARLPRSRRCCCSVALEWARSRRCRPATDRALRCTAASGLDQRCSLGGPDPTRRGPCSADAGIAFTAPGWPTPMPRIPLPPRVVAAHRRGRTLALR